MELYGFYTSIIFALSITDLKYETGLIIAIAGALAIWLTLFIFQAIGLFVMAKKRGVRHKWLAFMPFANVIYMGKLAGECSFFGQKMKRAGLYTMLAQIIGTLLTFSVLATVYLYFKQGKPSDELELWGGTPQWSGLVGFDRFLGEYLLYSGFIIMTLELVYKVLSLVLIMGICKKYSPSNYILLSFLVLFIPEARYILIFVLRKRKAIDYGAYIKAKQEEFLRRQQQYYNTYGNPYNRPNGYGNPYGGPYGNPYNQPPQQPQKPQQPEEPFSEFSSDETPWHEDGEEVKTDGKSEGKKEDSDEFFN